MNIKFLLLLLSTASLLSCSTAYRSGQTPDDVYYSPVRVIEEDNKNEQEEDSRLDSEERQIRMSTRDRRWRDLDREYEYDRTYTPYNHCCCNPYYYNPYYYPAPLYYPGVTVSTPKNTTPRTTSLASYNNPVVNLNPKTGNPTPVNSTRAYNNSNRNTNYTRKIFSPSTSGSTENNTRTYTPSSGSSKSSNSSSNSGSVPRPARRN